ncbi:putative bifunctional diguanylate cyclase/phosphodiesterase [Plantactinospora sp. KLBMP9567]|uniref:putative bifunctional diguanylate cyclase/phosphodiesterase n=1 Tax=Plantactinospora sp. KLBMP9567 TaxID=3085900 RepID=UPI002980F103|nr:EAL domain-containing protein [Plantactinospora sp. KLBMP9567]MDW5329021.1 EAL domain-containing protein [Plantactinospora sp. KLBMP9567]
MEAAVLRNSVPPDRTAPFFGFVWAVVGLAVGVSAVSLLALPGELSRLPLAFWLMAALAVTFDARPFSPHAERRSMSVFPSICFTFAIALEWGPGPAIAVQAAAVLVSGWRMRYAPWRTIFNIAQYACALAAADAVVRLVPGDGFGSTGRLRPLDVLVAIGAAGAWLTVNHGLVASAVRLRFGGRWWTRIRQGLGFELLATGSLLLLAPVLVAAARTSPALVPMMVLPLYAVSRMARLSAEREQLARQDPLTGLANREALLAEVTEQVAVHAELAGKQAPGGQLALLLLDLDRFKHVNDALGHAVGDRLLVEVAARLTTAVRPPDVIARLGGDEFAILATRLDGVADARRVADRVVGELVDPVPLDGLPLDVGGSIGIALYPEHGADFATLMRHADVAMYDAKHRGDPVAVYAAESDHNSAERLSLLADLRRVLETGADDAGEITLYYQPQIAIATGEVVGVEALLRWRHPRRGMVDPEELIRVAEQSAVMRLLTRRVVDDVVEQLAKWSAAGLELRAAVNVSVRDLHTGEIADQIAERLAQYAVPPSRIQLEMTEGALMADPRRVLATISRLDRIGVAISLDDFGTGYSSMQHLRRLPLAEVKVDRSFVLGMVADADDAAIVRSVIELAGALGLRVVAEGVEDERTWRLLHEAGCEAAQGWFFARPMPAEDLVTWLARYRPVSPAARLGTGGSGPAGAERPGSGARTERNGGPGEQDGDRAVRNADPAGTRNADPTATRNGNGAVQHGERPGQPDRPAGVDAPTTELDVLAAPVDPAAPVTRPGGPAKAEAAARLHPSVE